MEMMHYNKRNKFINNSNIGRMLFITLDESQ